MGEQRKGGGVKNGTGKKCHEGAGEGEKSRFKRWRQGAELIDRELDIKMGGLIDGGTEEEE